MRALAGAANRALLRTRDLSTAASARPCCARNDSVSLFAAASTASTASTRSRQSTINGVWRLAAGVVLQCRRGPSDAG
jgi:hypothetical protein